jgi:hypothetical protein
MCVCGLAPLLGCRPIRVRVSCESIYCTPSPMQYNKHSTFQYGIRGLGFPRFPPTAASSSQRPSRRPPASAPPSPGGPQSAGPDPPLAWARTSASVPLLRAGVAAACPPPPARALFPRRNRPRSSAAAAFFPGHGAGSSLNVAPSSALARRRPWCASAQALFPWRNWPQSRSRGLLPRRLPPPVVGQCLAHLRQVPERAGRGGLGDGVTRPADLDERDSAVVPDDRARDADRRCSVAAFFSRPTALPDTASRTSGGRTPSDTSSASEAAPDPATWHTAVAAFSQTAGADAVSSCTSVETLARPSVTSTPRSSLRSAPQPSYASCAPLPPTRSAPGLSVRAGRTAFIIALAT